MEADIPGVVDTRLAGWRTGKAPDASEEQHRASDTVGAGADLEPVCGDVVEVRCWRYCFAFITFIMSLISGMSMG